MEYGRQIVQQELTRNVVLVRGCQNNLEAVAIEAWLVRRHQNDFGEVAIEAWLVRHHQIDLEEVGIEVWPGLRG